MGKREEAEMAKVEAGTGEEGGKRVFRKSTSVVLLRARISRARDKEF